MTDREITRRAASGAVTGLGWRHVLGSLRTSVAVPTMTDGVQVAATAVEAAGDDAAGRLRVDVRDGHVELCLQSLAARSVDSRDVELAHVVSEALAGLGYQTQALAGDRPVTALEIAIDALDIAAVLPFWRAVMAYTDEPGSHGDALVDPRRSGPTIWFQQMDAPRPQRNRIHLDVTVPHDVAEARIAAALAAGGRLVSDDAARAFWILADAEGNEVCVCTWQDRDPT
jgi:4a-hydroxytetrahydrobiopterin dehydratase